MAMVVCLDKKNVLVFRSYLQKDLGLSVMKPPAVYSQMVWEGKIRGMSGEAENIWMCANVAKCKQLMKSR